MNRIDKKFKELKKLKQKALIPFITCGDPNLETTKKLVLEFSKIGADIIELGLPFSDPVADGPVIQAASARALKNNITLEKILKLVKNLRQKTQTPLCLMTYYNPIFNFGLDKFAKLAQVCGLDGVIIPDLPPEEAKELIKAARINNLATIFFISPTTSSKRVKLIDKSSRGFIYYVSLTGVTGIRKNLPNNLINNLSKLKKQLSKPLCVGFGVSKSGQIKKITKFSDGVIIGSAIVKKIEDNLKNKNLINIVSNFIRNLAKVAHQDN